MLIDIRGFNPQNLGSCLMLLAAQARLRQAFPDAQLSVGLSNDDLQLSLRHRARFGMLGRWPERWRGIPVDWLGHLVPTPVQRSLRITKDRDFQAVVDISGFAYGDFWGAEKLRRRLGRNLPEWKRQRRKVILLPQAFGPFTDADLAQGMRTVMDGADLVFPRDRVSVRYLSELGVPQEKLEQFPDFTHEVPAFNRDTDPAPRTYFCVIPNSKLTVGKSAEEVQRYIQFLLDATGYLSRVLGMPPVLLRFGGREDADLVDELLDQITPTPTSFIIADPRYAKGLIAGSAAVVSSRFHAIMSALGSAVPCLAVGWSHKYGEAMDEFGCAKYSLSLANPDFNPVLQSFADDIMNGTLKTDLARAAEQQRQATDRMWDKVIHCIGEPQ
ncbi:MAG TPA: polysaccharide pyruvyl transferase family protein [Burkholderiales bacterium]|nr:polysaccharide pyruvyl transferase family protein [Burkholderiales bacterium]